ncbi:glycosyltransferase family 2 protein [Aequorivita marisscotiae]|uniref:Glycosyltransferase family A protein n=1 Tax=Aequorivita marisscotiae TaxID=3040348 RepID=A0ABY8KTH0_9FLAO|nr:glycosyltransferase family A protein [Aequorivita sp. Ant34-E75]WGF92734.1 glycosyltransferase family A protein [Aequorivita sp. Ant34-E75]
MIFIIHQNNRVLKVLDNKQNKIAFNRKKSIADTLFNLATQFPNNLIIWCNRDYFDYINLKALPDIFHHRGILASFSFSDNNFLPNQIGYVDLSIYIKINKKVCYPTWLLSGDVGGVHAEVLNAISKDFNTYSNFHYFLNALAKTAMHQGLFCYSHPNLLLGKPNTVNQVKQASTFVLFQFVKEHYKWNWVYILFTAFIIFEKKFPIIPLLKSLFYKKIEYDFDFTKIPFQTSRNIIDKREIDVIIPTIGRKVYLYDVLKDLSRQTLLPKNVIIVEQNPIKNSVSELNYLYNEKWPFNIKHRFINKMGVCNARNIAIDLVESEWVFFGDDDIRFNKLLVEKAFINIKNLGVRAINFTCLQPLEEQTYFKIAQTPIFGSGSSVVKSELFKNIKFDLSYEYGYREDSDFGMQIRWLGEDVIFIPDLIITHLKAPVGGFRKKPASPWKSEKQLPKPSPTVMLFNLKYFTKQQKLGYKLMLFVKNYKSQSIKNPINYVKNMRKGWCVSLTWAEKINYNGVEKNN